MANARKAAAYSKRKVTPYTRISRKKGKSYIKTVPPQKIVKFLMGRGKKLPHVLTVVATEKVQIRDTSLEACRQVFNKKLEREFAGMFVFRVIPFPHHIQRENKMLTGAGADRMQTGMQLAFGRATGKSAILKPSSRIFEIEVPTLKGIAYVRKIAKEVKAKLPCKTKVVYELRE